MGALTRRVPSTPAVRGRPFPVGNGGRRPGSRNRTSMISAALLQGEKEELLRKAVELAKDGDVPMLKFLLGLPKTAFGSWVRSCGRYAKARSAQAKEQALQLR